ncbi:MAG: helix-turn-helix domain-containing protein [Treponema sp.]|nr:helix-turn-helix domain-containing protein [Treponema sp.]
MKKNTLNEPKKYSHLSFEEREEIAIALENGKNSAFHYILACKKCQFMQYLLANSVILLYIYTIDKENQ